MGEINIFYYTPYSQEKNLAKEYNKYIENIKSDDDWICLMDGDIMFLTPDYGTQIYNIVNNYKNVGLFTCYTNRVKNKEQCYEGFISMNDSLGNHRKIAMYVQQEYRDVLKYTKDPISGFLMLFSKRTWKEVGGFNEDLKILGVDSDFTTKIIEKGKKIAIMRGVYVLHYYRLLEGIKYKKHLR